MAVIYSKWPQHKPTFSISRPSKIYPIWDFWSGNILSGNPGSASHPERRPWCRGVGRRCTGGRRWSSARGCGRRTGADCIKYFWPEITKKTYNEVKFKHVIHISAIKSTNLALNCRVHIHIHTYVNVFHIFMQDLPKISAKMFPERFCRIDSCWDGHLILMAYSGFCK
jgi:hypothetical protein